MYKTLSLCLTVLVPALLPFQLQNSKRLLLNFMTPIKNKNNQIEVLFYSLFSPYPD